MKLNWDCFYNVLQTIEQHSTTTSNLPFSIFGDLQKEYGKDQVEYCLHQAYEADLLIGDDPFEVFYDYLEEEHLERLAKRKIQKKESVEDMLEYLDGDILKSIMRELLS